MAQNLFTFLLLSIPLTRAITLDCAHIRVDDTNFDLSALGGPRRVSVIESQPPSVRNTTFFLDLCRPLGKIEGLADGEQCPGGTRVCAVERDTNTVENTTSVNRVIPIAGEFGTSNGRSLDPKYTRLKNSKSNSDADREGIIIELNGGKYPDQRSGQVQQAILQLECDTTRTGNERRAEKDDDNEEEDDDSDKSLVFKSFKVEDKVQVLRLNWRTKYACEDVPADEDDGAKKGGWGVFGWLFIIVFLGAAAYLIFGSWLNYTRYGARGWDLVPHGDAIRDMPYLVKDWGKSVIDTVQGRGYRGGYAAV